jgi:hypothetical protein
MSERRYSDDEVAAIFARATETQQEAPRHSTPGEGMTLAELQEIGREVGIDPDEVARAARSLEAAPAIRQPPPARYLGLPVGVAHVVELPYRMTEAAWERLVVDLRETFDAPGRVRSDGTFRQWSNGNLQVLVEPYGEGQRVRFRTMKGSSRSLMTIGGIFMVIALVMIVMGLLTPGNIIFRAANDAGTFALVGAILFGVGAVQVPGWARLRKSQMEEIADRLLRDGPDRGGSDPFSPPPVNPLPRSS